MPVSNPQHLPALIHLVSALQPRRVLDVGIGTGSLGLLARQTLDICYGRIEPAEWEITIDGVEIFEGYRNPVWHYAYTQVHLGDIRELLPSLERYDLVCCCDVLEHFEHAEARRIIRGLLEHSQVLLATTPNRLIPQEAWGGNEAERHLSLVNRKDFPGLALHHRGSVTDLFAASLAGETRRQIERIGDFTPRSISIDPGSWTGRLRRKLRRLISSW